MKINKFSDFILNENSLFEEDVKSDSSKLTLELVSEMDKKRPDVKKIKELVEAGADVKSTDSDSGASVLHIASATDNIDLAKLCLDNGVAVDVKDNSEFTPLLWAVSYDSPNVLKLLIDSGANVNAKGSDGKSSFELAKSEDSKEALKILSSSFDFSNFKFEGKVYDFSKLIPTA